MPKIRSCSKAAFWLSIMVTACFAFTPFHVPGSEELGDKTIHGFAFLVMLFLGDLGYPDRLLKLSMILTGYGLLIEVVQYFLPNRHFSLYDLLADAAGILLYIISRFTIAWISGWKVLRDNNDTGWSDVDR